VAAASSDPLLVLTTTANAEEARRFATEAVERKLAACVNVAAIGSTYRWRGRVENAEECLLLIKTTQQRFDAIRDLIRERSSYELPEVLAIPVRDGSADYLAWLRESVDGG
jgi:periplasmic divalent cation tolerance protein